MFTCKKPIKQSFKLNDARNAHMASKLRAIHEAIKHQTAKHLTKGDATPTARAYAAQALILEDFGWAAEHGSWTDKGGLFVEYRIAPLDSGRVGRTSLIADFEAELQRSIFLQDPNPIIIRNPGWEKGEASVEMYWHVDTVSIGD